MLELLPPFEKLVEFEFFAPKIYENFKTKTIFFFLTVKQFIFVIVKILLKYFIENATVMITV
jgi:hypothetical protein